MSSLFDLVVSAEKVNAFYAHVRTDPGYAAARAMLDDSYQSLTDPDGNFLEQFQTTGFDARCFELYLSTYFSRAGFQVRRPHPHPDFVVSRAGIDAAIECTTSNPPQGTDPLYSRQPFDLSPVAFHHYVDHELPIRLGNPLTRKMARRYWESVQCNGLPFVLAIELFHAENALRFSSSALATYLYGQRHHATVDPESGKLSVHASAGSDHAVGEKKPVATNFFAQDGAENVSAVVFSNSGTVAKFSRMGIQHGLANNIVAVRQGQCYDPDPDAQDATIFTYDVRRPPYVEWWGQGLAVFHNPRALLPLPHGYFVGASDNYMEDGRFATAGTPFDPFSSITSHLVTDSANNVVAPTIFIQSLPKAEFARLAGVECPPQVGVEEGWFADDTRSFIAVLVRDRVDRDWTYVLLARDQNHRFRAIHTEVSITDRNEASLRCRLHIMRLVQEPKRLFSQ